jgi:hypothetical protein
VAFFFWRFLLGEFSLNLETGSNTVGDHVTCLGCFFPDFLINFCVVGLVYLYQWIVSASEKIIKSCNTG